MYAAGYRSGDAVYSGLLNVIPVGIFLCRATSASRRKYATI